MVRSQGSGVRNQESGVRDHDLGSGGRGKSYISGTLASNHLKLALGSLGKEKRAGVIDHRSEHLAHFGAHACESGVVVGCEITAVAGEVEGGVGLAILTVAVGQLVDEMGLVSAFRPSFAEVRADGPRRPSDLIGEGVLLLRREPL